MQERQREMTEQLYLPELTPLTQGEHYDYDPLGKKLALAGAGPLAFITRDQIHPPMVDDEEIWKGGKWYEGARQHTLEAAQLCQFKRGERVLDIGCGVCGPARLLVDTYGVGVYAVATSEQMLRTAREINKRDNRWKTRIECIRHNCQDPYPTRGFDVAWSMNMLYHVASHQAMLENARDALKPGGRLMVDDWMFTHRANNQDREAMGFHFMSSYFAVRERFVEELASHGFQVLRFADLGHIGRTHLCRYFRPVFDTQFRPLFLKYDRENGEQSADHFLRAIELSCKLYQEEKLTYFRVVARKL